MHDYRRILALIELEPDDAGVLRRALALARAGRAELALLHLIAPDPALAGGYPAPGPGEAGAAHEAAALRRLRFFAASQGAGAAACAGCWTACWGRRWLRTRS